MIVCDLCNKNVATVHLTEIVDHNVKKELHLCDACAKDKGIAGKLHQFSLADIVGGLVEQPNEKTSELLANAKCHNCGLVYKEFKAKTRFGCEEDYELLREAVVPLLEKIHGSTQYIGRVPPNLTDQAAFERQVLELERHLEKAVKAEDYETAARLRDRIKEIAERK
ncbi:MAG: UvrB/UvrC motif-containing protein [Planctomycetota bacterium]|nr:UvrB/UvrC motif-containing protein [Planctomycetota bacterium]